MNKFGPAFNLYAQVQVRAQWGGASSCRQERTRSTRSSGAENLPAELHRTLIRFAPARQDHDLSHIYHANCKTISGVVLSTNRLAHACRKTAPSLRSTICGLGAETTVVLQFACLLGQS